MKIDKEKSFGLKIPKILIIYYFFLTYIYLLAIFSCLSLRE